MKEKEKNQKDGGRKRGRKRGSWWIDWSAVMMDRLEQDRPDMALCRECYPLSWWRFLLPVGAVGEHALCWASNSTWLAGDFCFSCKMIGSTQVASDEPVLPLRLRRPKGHGFTPSNAFPSSRTPPVISMRGRRVDQWLSVRVC